MNMWMKDWSVNPVLEKICVISVCDGVCVYICMWRCMSIETSKEVCMCACVVPSWRTCILYGTVYCMLFLYPLVWLAAAVEKLVSPNLGVCLAKSSASVVACILLRIVPFASIPIRKLCTNKPSRRSPHAVTSIRFRFYLFPPKVSLYDDESCCDSPVVVHPVLEIPRCWL